MIKHYVLAFKDPTDEQYTPVYQIISQDNIVISWFIDSVSAALTEYELWLLKIYTQESATINVLFDKLLTWYQQEEFPLRRARFVYKKELFY